MLIAIAVFAVGVTKMFYGDRGTVAFAAIPLIFITLLTAVNKVYLRFYKRKFSLLLRDDSWKEKSFGDIVISMFVVGLPLGLPVLYLFMLRR